MRQDGKDHNLTAFQYMLAGGATGTFTRFLLQPLDVLKITFQLQMGRQDSKKYTSIFQAVKTIVREEGIFGLWKGHIPAQFLSVIFGAVQFSTYEKLTRFFYNTHPIDFTHTEHIINIGSGAMAGFAATVASFPFDVVKTHLVFQSEPKIYKGTVDAVIKIYQREGPRGFTKGMLAACIQTMPMSGLVFCFHGLFSQIWLLVYRKIDARTINLTTTGDITTGLCAGLCAKTIVYPYDLMKKRLQIQGLEHIHSKGSQILVCKNIRDCFKKTVKSEGFLGLFKGFTPSILKSGATTSLYFTFYSKLCDLIKHLSEKR